MFIIKKSDDKENLMADRSSQKGKWENVTTNNCAKWVSKDLFPIVQL